MARRYVDFEIVAETDNDCPGFVATAIGHHIVTQGDTPTEIIDMCLDALLCYFDGVRIDGRPAPVEAVPCVRRVWIVDHTDRGRREHPVQSQ